MYIVRTQKFVAGTHDTMGKPAMYVGGNGVPTAVRHEAMRFDLADACTEADLWSNGTLLFQCEQKCCHFEVTLEGKPAHG